MRVVIVRQNPFDKDEMFLILDFTDNAPFIAADIKNDAFFENISVIKSILQINKVMPIGNSNRFNPIAQRGFRFGIFLIIPFDCAFADDSHRTTLQLYNYSKLLYKQNQLVK